MKKDLIKLFTVLCLFALGEGAFYNFLELWMMDNNLSLQTTSTILSLCSLVGMLLIFLCTNLIKKDCLKRFVEILFILKGLLLVFLYFLNQTNHPFWIKLIIMVEQAINTEIKVSIYPLMSNIKMDDKTYGRKDIYYNLFYYLALLLTGLHLGKSIGSLMIDYNSYALISAFIILIAYIVLKTIKLNIPKEKNNNDIIIFRLFKKISKDKISISYLWFLFLNQITYYSVVGMVMTFLTKYFSFSPSVSSNIRVYLGISSAILAIIILRYITFKNDYLNLSIKFVIRGIFFILALLINTKKMYFIAFAYPILLSTSYSHITCAPYINRFKGDDQFAFCNFREMIGYLGMCLGIFICGRAFNTGIFYNILIALVSLIFQLLFSFRALYFRKKEKA